MRTAKEKDYKNKVLSRGACFPPTPVSAHLGASHRHFTHQLPTTITPPFQFQSFSSFPYFFSISSR